MTDDEIIAAMRAGDRRAGDRLSRRYYRELSTYYRKRLPTEEAEELTQATLLETVARIDRFRGESSFHHYVFSVARRVLAEYQRRVRRQIITAPPPSCEPAADDTSPSERLARSELFERVLELVETLDEHYRSVLELRLDGMTNFEISESLGIHYNTVRSRMSRGLSVIRACLGAAIDEFFAVTPPKSAEAPS